jgi:hypothetical protein
MEQPKVEHLSDQDRDNIISQVQEYNKKEEIVDDNEEIFPPEVVERLIKNLTHKPTIPTEIVLTSPSIEEIQKSYKNKSDIDVITLSVIKDENIKNKIINLYLKDRDKQYKELLKANRLAKKQFDQFKKLNKNKAV